MGIYNKIIEKLQKKFEPDFLEVIDESEKHRGHANWIEGKSTHFKVRIGAKSLYGSNRVAQHRSIMEALGEEFDAGLHALAIEIVDKNQQ